MSTTPARTPRLPLIVVILGGLAAIVAASVAVAPRPAPAFVGTTFTDTAAAPPFALTDHDGRPATLQSFRGQPLIVFFGYTHCPDVCPLTLAKLNAAADGLGKRGRDLRIALVTMDPARDTPSVLKAYAARFGPRVVGLTGDSAALARAAAGYGAYATFPDTAASASAHAGHEAHGAARRPAAMSHSRGIYGIDRAGNLQVIISDTATPDEVEHDLALLLKM